MRTRERIVVDPATGEPVVQLDAAEQAELDEAIARFWDGEVYVVTDVHQFLREQQARWEQAEAAEAAEAAARGGGAAER